MSAIFEILGILFVALVVVCGIILAVLIFNVRNLEITCVCGKRFGRLPNTAFNDKGTREVVTRARYRLHRIFNCKGEMEEYVMSYYVLGQIRVLAESYKDARNVAHMKILHEMGHLDIEELLIDGYDCWEWEDKYNV